MFITFEGIDGCGKSTQALLLCDYLEACGHNVVLTREPYILRNVISGLKDKTGKAAVMTFMADRAIHVDEIIKPALDDNCFVICDRWVDSTEVYQTKYKWEGYIKELSEFAADWLIPDITFLLDVDPNVAMKRNGGVDEFDLASISVHASRQSRYLKIAEANPDRFKVIYGERSEERVHKDIIEHVDSFLQKK